MSFLLNIRKQFGVEVADEALGGTYASVWLEKDSALRLYSYYRGKIDNLQMPRKYHITTTYSKTFVPNLFNRTVNIVLKPKDFKYEKFGDSLVLLVDNPILRKLFRNAIVDDATYDFDQYRPHITLCTDFTGDIKKLPPTPKFNLYADKYKVEALKEDWS